MSLTAVHHAYERHGPALLRKAERILQNPDDAGDIVQSLFVDLMQRRRQNLKTFELPYLYRAVTNRCLNHIRNHHNRQRLIEQQTPALRGPVRTRCDHEVLGLDLLCKVIDSLDRKSQEILICRYWDDMSQEEIASLLGTSRKTVGKRLSKIRNAVQSLAGNGDGDGSQASGIKEERP